MGITENLNDTTPAAPSGKTNIKFQANPPGGTRQISGYMPNLVGDSGSGGTAGAVPAPSSGDAAAGKFLRADATWAVPSVSGGGGGGTVTTTGSPANGNLTKFSGATSITNGDLSGDVTTSGTLATTLANSGVSAGSYTSADITVDAKGRVTAASNGSGGGGGGSGALVLLEEHTASSSASLDFTTRNVAGVSGATFQSDYDVYKIVFVCCRPATDNDTLQMLVSQNGGSTWDSTAGHYSRIAGYWYSGGTGTSGNTADSSTYWEIADSVGNDANYGVNGSIELFQPRSSNYKAIVGSTMMFHAVVNSTLGFTICGHYLQTATIDAFQIKFGSGNITSGTVRVYGIAK